MQEWDDRSNKDITKYYTDLDDVNVGIPPAWFFHFKNDGSTPYEEGGFCNFDFSKLHLNSKTIQQKENDPKIGGFVNFSENVSIINTIRINNKLNNIKNLKSFSLPFNDKTNNNNNEYKEKMVLENSITIHNNSDKTFINQQKEKTDSKTDLMRKITDLKEFIDENRKAGYTISIELLLNKYSKEFIDNCIKNNLLIKKGEEYEVRYY